MKNYIGRIYPMDVTCMSGFTPGCLWGPYFIDVEIPDEDVNTLGESAIFSYKDRKGVVELIPAENLPTSSETGFNPDSWIFRTGDR
uniref:Uncharacterized protein n=1 Tax=Acrobeloides nanus TaxID=290746 RepID=A0A914DVJ1_9BILA